MALFSSSPPQLPLMRGSCACKALNWSATSFPTNVIYCWCRACRKRSGAPFIPFGDIASDAITWSPEDKIKRHKAPNAAMEIACAECNSTLGLQYPFLKQTTSIVLGSIWCPDTHCCAENAARLDLRPRAHVYVGQKCAWFDVPSDGAPRFDGHTPLLERLAEEWRQKKDRETLKRRK